MYLSFILWKTQILYNRKKFLSLSWYLRGLYSPSFRIQMHAIFLLSQTAKPQYISLFFKFLCRHWFVRLFSTFDSLYQTFCLYLKGVFVWRWNRKDKKFWRENRKENVFRVCLVKWGERKINDGERMPALGVFSLGPPKKFLPKIGRKLGEGSSWNELPKIPLMLDFTSNVSPFFFFFFIYFNEVSIYTQFFKSIMCYFLFYLIAT